jgi:hypothetical protein
MELSGQDFVNENKAVFRLNSDSKVGHLHYRSLYEQLSGHVSLVFYRLFLGLTSYINGTESPPARRNTAVFPHPRQMKLPRGFRRHWPRDWRRCFRD